MSLLFVCWCFDCSCCAPCCWHVYLYFCAVLPAIVCCYAVVCSCVLVCAVVLLCLCPVFVFFSLLFSSLLFSFLVLSCPCLILSCLLFVSSWGSCGVILGRLGAFQGSFLVVLGHLSGSTNISDMTHLARLAGRADDINTT